MLNKRTQAGMTMWGVMMVFALIAFFSLLTLKLLPPYLENMRVKTVLANLQAQPNVASMSNDDVRNALERRFDIEDVTRVDLRKDLKVEMVPNSKQKRIRIVYQVQVPLAYNVSALMDFDDSVEVARVD
jgi:hypothetical protein